jgi:hypothetical protein
MGQNRPYCDTNSVFPFLFSLSKRKPNLCLYSSKKKHVSGFGMGMVSLITNMERNGQWRNGQLPMGEDN